MQKSDKQIVLDEYISSLSPTGKKQYPQIARRVLFGFRLDDGPHVPGIDFSKPSVEKFVQALRDYGYADGTIEFYWRVIRRLFKVKGEKWPFTRHDNPTVNEMNVLSLALPYETVKKMIDAHHRGQLTIHESYFLALSTIYGLRDKEMADLTPAHFDLKRRMVFVETAKSGRQRYHLIPDETYPIFEELVPHLPPFNRHNAIRAFHSVEKKAGIRHVPETGWHAVRHSITHFLFKAGLDQPSIELFMRWKTKKGDMASNYAKGRFVSEDGGVMNMSNSDTDQDRQVFEVHPFLPLWRG